LDFVCDLHCRFRGDRFGRRAAGWLFGGPRRRVLFEVDPWLAGNTRECALLADWIHDGIGFGIDGSGDPADPIDGSVVLADLARRGLENSLLRIRRSTT